MSTPAGSACDSGRVNLRLPVAAAFTVALAVALAGCSSSATTSTTVGATVAPDESSSPEPSSSEEAAPTEPIDIELPLVWATDEVVKKNRGYMLDLEQTARAGIFDGHFFFQAKDGAVKRQQFVTVTVVAPDRLQVRWPEGVADGTLALTGDGGQAQINLAPGCLQYLDANGTEADCLLSPYEGGGGEDVQPSDAATAAAELPSDDDAMGYLCSVEDPDQFEKVTSKDSDAFATAVLQTALTNLGLDPGPVDGSYGKKTRAAVKIYQQAAGLNPDGLVGPQTWSSLQADACTLPDDPAT